MRKTIFNMCLIAMVLIVHLGQSSIAKPMPCGEHQSMPSMAHGALIQSDAHHIEHMTAFETTGMTADCCQQDCGCSAVILSVGILPTSGFSLSLVSFNDNIVMHHDDLYQVHLPLPQRPPKTTFLS